MKAMSSHDPPSVGHQGPGKPADWNVVVTVEEDGFRDALRFLQRWGAARRTSYYNVIALTVADRETFLAGFAAAVAEAPGILNVLSHVVPAQEIFDFATPEAFESEARRVALGWIPKLRGKGFHVRLHRRGFKGALSTPREERFLDEALLAALDGDGRIDFTNPDAIIQIETIDGRAGMSLWTREDLRSWPFLGVH